jgi:hypothetical protein
MRDVPAERNSFDQTIFPSLDVFEIAGGQIRKTFFQFIRYIVPVSFQNVRHGHSGISPSYIWTVEENELHFIFIMKSTLRIKSRTGSELLEPEFAERRTRKPARSTIASADTAGQKKAATRARQTAKSTGSAERRSTPVSARQKKQGVTQGSKKASSARSRSPRSN